jgi:hypothetical protein
MEAFNHSLTSLFEQLGLGSTNQEIENFVEKHSPLPGSIELHNADFWSTSQASFIRQAKDEDADWAEMVDQLDVMLRLTHE